MTSFSKKKLHKETKRKYSNISDFVLLLTEHGIFPIGPIK